MKIASALLNLIEVSFDRRPLNDATHNFISYFIFLGLRPCEACQ